MVWRRNILLQLDPDHHCAVDPWYFCPDPQIWNTASRTWIYIRIRLRIHDILVRIRRSEPLAQESGSILRSGSGSMIFWSGSGPRSEPLQLNPDHHCAVDPWYFGPDPQIPATDSRIWIYIRIRLRDILVRIRRSEPLTQGSGSILGSGSGFESGFGSGFGSGFDSGNPDSAPDLNPDSDSDLAPDPQDWFQQKKILNNAIIKFEDLVKKFQKAFNFVSSVNLPCTVPSSHQIQVQNNKKKIRHVWWPKFFFF